MAPFFHTLKANMYVSANYDTKNFWSQIWHQEQFKFQKSDASILSMYITLYAYLINYKSEQLH